MWENMQELTCSHLAFSNPLKVSNCPPYLYLKWVLRVTYHRNCCPYIPFGCGNAQDIAIYITETVAVAHVETFRECNPAVSAPGK